MLRDLRITVLLLLLAVGGLDAALRETGSSLLPEIMHHGELHDVPEGMQAIGADGPPAWYWPGLADGSITYRRVLTLPANARIMGLLIASTGSGDNDTCLVRITSGASLLTQLGGVVVGGAGQFQQILLDSPIPADGGAQLAIEVERSTSEPPLPTADETCIDSGSSFIRVGSGSFTSVSHNLNLRLLVEWAPDLHGPELRLAEEPIWGTGNATIPLRVLARDLHGVSSLVALRGQDSTALGFAGRSGTQSDWEEWAAELTLPQGLEAGQSLNWTLVAMDSLGNASEHSFEPEVVAGYAWSREGGRGDQTWRQFQPAVPGALSALRVPLGLIRSSNQLDSLGISGAYFRMRGEGRVRALLVADNGGRPSGQSPEWDLLAPPDTVLLGEDCAGWQEVEFMIPDSLQGSVGDQVWVLLDANFPESALNPPAPLFEWLADSLSYEDSLSTSYGFDPLRSLWRAVEDGNFLLRARLDARDCSIDLRDGEFFADFDDSYADLECLLRSPQRIGYGWQHSTEGLFPSDCFFPDSTSGFPEAMLDPLGLQSGGYVAISSDDAGSPILNDTLFLPVMMVDGDVQLELLSLFATNFINQLEIERAQILFRSSSSLLESEPWLLKEGGDNFAQDADTTILCGVDADNNPLEFAAGSWRARTYIFDDLQTDTLFQLALTYFGDYAFGWAVDNIRVSQSGTDPNPSPWDGPQVKSAELGRVHPNPFNPATVIPYRVLESGPLNVAIYNLRGQRVKTLLDSRWEPAGTGSLRFAPEGLSSGIYFVRLQARGSTDTRRLLYLR